MKEGNICVKHVRPSQSGETESISEFRIVSGLFAVYGHSFFFFFNMTMSVLLQEGMRSNDFTTTLTVFGLKPRSGKSLDLFTLVT